MENAALNHTSPSHPRPASGLTVDLADLVQSLISLEVPSREIDHVVEAMLGGSDAHPEIGVAPVVASRWLADETPTYTAGGPAASVLARRRGYRLTVEGSGASWSAEARNLRTGTTCRAMARIEGAAAVAAIAGLAAKEATT